MRGMNNHIRIGIICPSEIAFRRFLPALKKSENFSYVGVAIASEEEWYGNVDPSDVKRAELLANERAKAQTFVDEYGGTIVSGYEAMIRRDDLDAIYIPLPPALHFRWAKLALEAGKHVFVEKPSTISAADSSELVRLAGSRGLALHENYMFNFHQQIEEIEKVIASGELGDVRILRIDFGFPRRAQNDFRYKKALGGGSLIDAGGYTMKLAGRLLGASAHIDCAKLNYTGEFEVDISGSATMSNDRGLVAQIAFGMDNAYKCTLEVWGSKARLDTGRILTAPAGFVPQYTITDNDGIRTVELPADDTFFKSIQYFARCVEDEATRKASYSNIVKQAELVDEFKEKAGQ